MGVSPHLPSPKYNRLTVTNTMGKRASKHAKNAFKEYDVDNDGYITKPNLKKLMVTQVKERVAAEKANRTDEMKEDVKSKLGAALSELQETLEIEDMDDMLEQVSQPLMANVDAVAVKMAEVLQERLTSEVNARVQAIVDKTDVNKDGKIGFEEFKSLMMDKEANDLFDKCLDLDTPLEE